MTQTVEILEKIKKSSILVVGDIMLDRFIYGASERISPEAPVPVLRIERENFMLGGAGNVLSNLSGLDVPCKMVAIIGADNEGKKVRAVTAGLQKDADCLIEDAGRMTTVKTRYIAGGQQLLRTDHENTAAISDDMCKKITDKIEELLPSVSAIALSDYNKGVLTAELIKTVMEKAKAAGIPVIVDPKRIDYTIYNGADIVTPNKKELAQAAGTGALKTDDEIENAARSVLNTYDIGAVICTRSEDGISVIPKDGSAVHIPTKVREVYDVSGAGDTVVAVIAACIAAGEPLDSAARLANMAGSIVVGKAGTTSIKTSDFAGVGSSPFHAPLMSWDDAKAQIKEWQEQGLKVGFTNGCFDIIHYGHVNYLSEARQRCDKLIMALNTDRSVKILKGESRPINDEGSRASVIGALGSIDMVVLFGAEKAGDDNTPCPVLDALRPDVIFKGGDYTEDQLPEAKTVRAYGGEVEIMPIYEGHSTTGIIEKSKSGKAA